MNERIRELARQAWDYVVSCDDQYSKSATDLFEEKFAELIVRECSKIIKAQKEQLCDDLQLWSDHDYGYEMAINGSIEILNKHFGVE
jgi:hypothetical protein